MKRLVCVLFVFPLMILFLSGCWSKRELNELAIITAFGIDKTREGYLVTVQVVNPSEVAGKIQSGRTEVVTFMESGETIIQAMRKISMDAPRRVYVAHLREVVFGEELAREGIGKALDVLSRHHEMRSDFYVTVAKGSKASDILKVTTSLEKMPARALFGALENSEKMWGATMTVELDELINSIVSKGKEPVLMGVFVKGNPDSGSKFENVESIFPKTDVRIDSFGVLKKDKLVGWLSEEESRGFNYIADNVKGTTETVSCEDGKLSVTTLRSKTKLKGKVENDKPKIDIYINSEGNVEEVECKIDLSKSEVIKEIEEKYTNQIKETIEATIQKVQEEYESDILGFGEVIHRANPKAWKHFEPNWDQEFANLEVDVHVKANIRRLGSISESFQKEIEE